MVTQKTIYYIAINYATFKLSVFCPSDTLHQINEPRFSDSVSLSFKTRLKSITYFAATLRKVNFKHGTRDGKHDDVTSINRNVMASIPAMFSGLKTKTGYIIRIMLANN